MLKCSVDLKIRKTMAKRVSEQSSMPKPDLFGSDSSFNNDAGDIVYHDLRQNAAINEPFGIDNNFMAIENIPISQRRIDIRPHSMINCKKCNQIRTNPRFRPSSFNCYNQLSNVQNMFQSHYDDDIDESSDDQVSFYKPSFPKNRRRFRYKNHAR